MFSSWVTVISHKIVRTKKIKEASLLEPPQKSLSILLSLRLTSCPYTGSAAFFPWGSHPALTLTYLGKDFHLYPFSNIFSKNLSNKRTCASKRPSVFTFSPLLNSVLSPHRHCNTYRKSYFRNTENKTKAKYIANTTAESTRF